MIISVPVPPPVLWILPLRLVFLAFCRFIVVGLVVLVIVHYYIILYCFDAVGLVTTVPVQSFVPAFSKSQLFGGTGLAWSNSKKLSGEAKPSVFVVFS